MATKRWNGKVITTSNQWIWNDKGSAEIGSYNMNDIYAAANESQENDNYNKE